MQETVKVGFDESIIEKLRNAFTSMDCVYTEAMQNARRANATRVDFRTTETGILTIRDNGDGISNLQDFLTLAGSGWNKQTIEKEGAFGMGSFAMLYACKYIIVASQGQRFFGETRTILNGHPINLDHSDVKEGTMITMTIDGLPENKAFFELISALATGFLIDVFVNGAQCEQPHRLNDDYVDIGVGKAIIPCMRDNIQSSRSSGSTLLYFQGLRVHKQDCEFTPYTIVHLNEQLFEVRMPDRDVLIDQKKQNKLIKEKLTHTMIAFLRSKKVELSSAEFATNYYERMCTWGCLYLLNDVCFVPKQALFKVTESPFCERSYMDDCFTEELSIHRNDIRKIITLPSYADEESVGLWAYAYHTEALCYETDSLDKGHWLHSHITVLEEISVSVVNKKSEAMFNGNWVSMFCVFGDSVLMDGPLGSVEITDDIVYYNETMFISNDFTDGDAINKANSFTNNDNFDESAFNTEVQIFSAFLTRHNGNTLDAFKSVLDNSFVGGLELTGKQFKVVFHATGLEVEEIAA